MKQLFLLLSFVLITTFTFAQTSIADARTYVIGSNITVTGIITSGPGIAEYRFIQDDSAGIMLFDPGLTGLNRGDSAFASGELLEINNQLYVGNLSTFGTINTGNPVPEEQIVSFNDINEDTESELLRIDSCIFSNPGGTFNGDSIYEVIASGDVGFIKLTPMHPLVGKTIPSYEFILRGVGFQYDVDYYMLPRDTSDIVKYSDINVITQIDESNITTSSITLRWQTDVPGTTNLEYGNTKDLELGNLSVAGTTSNHAINISGAAPSEVFFARGFSTTGTDTTYTKVITVITQSLSSGDIMALFTQFTDSSVANGTFANYAEDAIDDTLISVIGNVTESLDILVSNYESANISDIANAVNQISAAGKKVRIIYDTTSVIEDFSSLVNIGIHKVPAPNDATHDKMNMNVFIIDAYATDPDLAKVFTSTNPLTDVDVNKNPNTALIIQDQSLAITFTLEFDEMWGSSTTTPDFGNMRFGVDKLNDSPHEFIIGNQMVECYFAPSDSTLPHIVSTIESSGHELFLQTKALELNMVGDAIENAITNGATAKILVHEKILCTQSIVNQIEALIGDDFKEFGEFGTLTNNVIISDPNNSSSDPMVLVSSNSWNEKSEFVNDENVLIFHSEELANWFVQEFSSRYKNGIPQENSVLEIQGSKNCKLYPNPVNDRFQIEVIKNVSGDLKISLYNIDGKLLQLVEVSSMTSLIDIDIKDLQLPAGSYFVNIRGNNINENLRFEKL